MWGGGVGQTPLPPSDTTGYSQRAGGTHPTGMHSRYQILLPKAFIMQFSEHIVLLTSAFASPSKCNTNVDTENAILCLCVTLDAMQDDDDVDAKADVKCEQSITPGDQSVKS